MTNKRFRAVYDVWDWTERHLLQSQAVVEREAESMMEFKRTIVQMEQGLRNGAIVKWHKTDELSSL